MTLKIYIVAAEPSGDALGADLIDALRKQDCDIEFAGIGGPAMARRGVPSLFNIDSLSVIGLIEGLRAYKTVKKHVEIAAEDIMKSKPDVVVLIDSWGFMWRVGQRMKELGSDALRVKLVGPQVWATRAGRAKILAQHVDHLLCIHQFETPFYEPYDLPTTVIGNPAVSRTDLGDKADFKQRHGITGKEVIGFLPGSRLSEMRRVLPVLEAAASKLCDNRPDRVVVCFAADAVSDTLRKSSSEWTFPHLLVSGDTEKADAFSAMDVALTCSGTVTTEVALQGTPIVVGYKIGWITWAIARAFLMKSPYLTLLNVAAGRPVAPEFIQTKLTPDRVSAAAEKILSNTSKRKAQIAAQFEALDTMGRGGRAAADIAAETILKLASSQ